MHELKELMGHSSITVTEQFYLDVRAELADRVRVRPATMTRMLQRMEEAGFVERRRDSRGASSARVAVNRLRSLSTPHAMIGAAKHISTQFQNDQLCSTTGDTVLSRIFSAKSNQNTTR